VRFAAITLCVASQRVILKISVYFVIDSVRKLLDIPSVCCRAKCGMMINFETKKKTVGGIVMECFRNSPWRPRNSRKACIRSFAFRQTCLSVGHKIIALYIPY
jgi:hypothetical protein